MSLLLSWLNIFPLSLEFLAFLLEYELLAVFTKKDQDLSPTVMSTDVSQVGVTLFPYF